MTNAYFRLALEVARAIHTSGYELGDDTDPKLKWNAPVPQD
jgi:hypothetical protein